MKIKIILWVFFIIPLTVQSQEKESLRFRIAFYNLENLFHPENDSLTNDDEFTQNGSRHWNYYRYWKKIKMIAKVIRNLGKEEAVDIIALAEIENEQVLKDLLKTDVLKSISYSYIHRNSPDKRGIDLAILYRNNKFFPISINFINPLQIKSREILYVSGIIPKGDSIDVFAVHYPSRYSGYKSSENLRIAVSNKIINEIDSIRSTRSNSKIIVLGDFNDEIKNKSLLILEERGNLIRMNTKGSHKHQGKWSSIDNIFISKALLKGRTKAFDAKIFDADYLLEVDEKYLGKKPFRTFSGFKYKGGFSDHLPIYLDLIIYK